jgi:hypothetical protein
VHARGLLRRIEDVTHMRARVTLQQSFQLGDALQVHFDLVIPED